MYCELVVNCHAIAIRHALHVCTFLCMSLCDVRVWCVWLSAYEPVIIESLVCFYWLLLTQFPFYCIFNARKMIIIIDRHNNNNKRLRWWWRGTSYSVIGFIFFGYFVWLLNLISHAALLSRCVVTYWPSNKSTPQRVYIFNKFYYYRFRWINILLRIWVALSRMPH